MSLHTYIHTPIYIYIRPYVYTCAHIHTYTHEYIYSYIYETRVAKDIVDLFNRVTMSFDIVLEKANDGNVPKVSYIY